MIGGRFVARQGDLVNSIEGVYTSTVVRDNVSAPQYDDMKYVIIKKVDTDTYELSDGIGGYYDLGRAYGIAYAALLRKAYFKNAGGRMARTRNPLL